MKVLIGLVLVAAVVVAIFMGMSYRIDVGANSANPLGDFAKIDKELTGKGLRKVDPGDKAEAQSLFDKRFTIADDMTVTAYVDLVPGMRHQTIVVRSPQGKVIGVVCRFQSGALSFSKTGTKCENFAALYWIALSGKDPNFTKEMEEGSDRREYLLAKFRKGPADGMWKKEGGGPVISMVPQTIGDTVTFILQ